MRKIKILSRIFLMLGLLLPHIIYTAPNSKIQKPFLAETRNLNNQNNGDAFSLNSSEIGWNGPFSFGITRDTLFDYTWNAQYTQGFGDRFALSGLVEYSSSMYRYSGTVGFGLGYANGNLFKFSAENLSQVLPFVFCSGGINQRVSQNAFGARYQYVFDNPWWLDISLGGYYANAPNKLLDPVFFTSQGMSAINLRNIAGAKSAGGDLGLDLKLTKYTLLTGHIYYDQVKYNQTYQTDLSNNAEDIGGGIGITQLLGDRLLVGLEASNRKIYDTYQFNVSWLPQYISEKLGLVISIIGERVVSHNETPNSDSIGLKLTFDPATIGSSKTTFHLPQPNIIDEISLWTSTPAVHMERVLVATDQKCETVPPTIISISPTLGSIAGGTAITINGANFIGTSQVTFDGSPALSFTVLSANEITCITPPHALGPVNLVVTNSAGSATTVFNYVVIMGSNSNGLTINSITPTAGPLSGNVLVKPPVGTPLSSYIKYFQIRVMPIQVPTTGGKKILLAFPHFYRPIDKLPIAHFVKPPIDLHKSYGNDFSLEVYPSDKLNNNWYNLKPMQVAVYIDGSPTKIISTHDNFILFELPPHKPGVVNATIYNGREFIKIKDGFEYKIFPVKMPVLKVGIL